MSDDEHDDQDENTEAYTGVLQGKKRKFEENDDAEAPQRKYRCLDMYVCFLLITYLAVMMLMKKATIQGGHLVQILI
jgi:hypothetical protein